MATETIESENQQLKHLGFIKIAAINTLICVSNLYEYAKQNSGPLRSGVRTVEGTVTTVVAPVCEKFRDVPYNLLVFLDKKVDEATNKFDKDAPSLAKKVVSQASCLVQKATKVTQTLVSKARTGGLPAAISCGLGIYKEFVLEQSVRIWFMLQQVPHFKRGAEMVVPTAANCSDKYNNLVMDMRQKGYSAFGYLPIVPLEKIAKTFNKKGE
ncbi:REF/SRPP-like protein At1g67360 [Telopea speciosissima]|uniref:REF/SRPP-like protein At1g67360 n=1 Tax=Telopea speciosissima TaxID=54955 RepID=UPI001CC6E070|nr:REF/SRPP-like protein At1g67360 [Telopea speciosissima]XP_043724252.1 REF/SRPP-like protein At1g67360 [Telopea speciosissima]